MQNRIAPSTQGRFAEVIEWLNWFEGALISWRDGKAVTGAVERLAEFRRHTHTVTIDPRVLEVQHTKINEWMHVEMSYIAFVADLERTAIVAPSAWNRLIENVRTARRWCEKNNPPEERKVFY